VPLLRLKVVNVVVALAVAADADVVKVAVAAVVVTRVNRRWWVAGLNWSQ